MADGIIKSSSSRMMGPGMPKEGKLTLSDKKLEFYGKSSGFYIAFGLLGSMLAKSKLQASIDVGSITGIKREKQALNNKILSVTTNDGENYRFTVPGYEDWERTVKEAAKAAGAFIEESAS